MMNTKNRSEVEQQTEDFGADQIQSRHGRINRWLFVVYLILIAWAIYYALSYWGGLGPGLDLSR